MGYMCAAADSEGLPVTSPRGMFDGFEGYRTASKDQQRDALRSAMVVVDTSVLLNLYRYTATTRDDLLKVLDRLGGRLWVPNQVMREFWRNRLSALGNHGSVAQQTRGSLDKQRRGTTDVVGRWASAIGLDGSEMKGLQGQVDTLYLSLSEAITRLQPADVGASGQTHEDAVLARLEPLLDGRVGPALPEEERARNITEGARRVRDKIPPGYMDAEKAEVNREEGAAGDYLVWVESMHEAARRTQDLIVVTSDEKEDWWLRHRGDLLGPRVELVAEFRAHCGRQLHLMTPSALLAQASALDVEVRPSSLENAARVDARREDGSEWTKEAVFELLRRLEIEGWEQAEVIRAAAADGGSVDRDTVYEIGGYADDRMLRGFTRPSARITRDLQAEDLLPEGVTPMLTPQYAGVRAAGFEIPREVVSILNEESETD